MSHWLAYIADRLHQRTVIFLMLAHNKEDALAKATMFAWKSIPELRNEDWKHESNYNVAIDIAIDVSPVSYNGKENSLCWVGSFPDISIAEEAMKKLRRDNLTTMEELLEERLLDED